MHQVDQKFNTTTLPAISDRRSVSPSKVVKVKSGALPSSIRWSPALTRP
jgi:hypothetical protein